MLIHWDHAGVSLNAVWSFYLLVGAPSAISSRRRFALVAQTFVPALWAFPSLRNPASGAFQVDWESTAALPTSCAKPRTYVSGDRRGWGTTTLSSTRWNGIRACGLGYSDWKEQLRPAASVDLVFCYSSGLGRSICAQPTCRYLFHQ